MIFSAVGEVSYTDLNLFLSKANFELNLGTKTSIKYLLASSIVVILLSLTSFINLPWKVPLSLSINPLAWDTLVVSIATPNCLQAYPNCVKTSLSEVLLSGLVDK